eukprot:Colp12_sorted_trinity150504_noHs@20530
MSGRGRKNNRGRRGNQRGGRGGPNVRTGDEQMGDAEPTQQQQTVRFNPYGGRRKRGLPMNAARALHEAEKSVSSKISPALASRLSGQPTATPDLENSRVMISNLPTKCDQHELVVFLKAQSKHPMELFDFTYRTNANNQQRIVIISVDSDTTVRELCKVSGKMFKGKKLSVRPLVNAPNKTGGGGQATRLSPLQLEKLKTFLEGRYSAATKMLDLSGLYMNEQLKAEGIMLDLGRTVVVNSVL